MSLWSNLFGKKTPAPDPPVVRGTAIARANRRVRVFISSTFRDMAEERDELMSRTWPALGRFCSERNVEFVEVDLRWGITESQSVRKETLKLCLDEISACRPFFIGLLGERYGWTPGQEVFTADLQQEQPWLNAHSGKSVTELEVLHGVLNNPELAGRAFFYFRDPAYAEGRGAGFVSDTSADANKQAVLKARIRSACTQKQIPLRDNYPDPARLAATILDDLTAAIEAQFPEEAQPDALTQESEAHEAFAESRRRTYIGRPQYFETLDRHAAGDGGPLLMTGQSGSGKSSLLANWVFHWREAHPGDVIVQHYIGGTADSSDHWRLMSRTMAEIKRWSGLDLPLPTERDAILTEFPRWLARGRASAARLNVRFILVLDALNQLHQLDHARLLGWLPADAFTGPLRLMVSALPDSEGNDDSLAAARKWDCREVHIEPLTNDERRQMIASYLGRFGKALDPERLNRIALAAPASNPLYLKTLLDDLRVTGTFDHLDERLTEYLAAGDISALLERVLARYQRDYDRDRPGLVGEALSLIFAARRGLSEAELLELLRPPDQPKLPPAIWSPLRAALEDALIDRGGILNFSHDFLRGAVGRAFAIDDNRLKQLRTRLADHFEPQPMTGRTSDELPWLLESTGDFPRLRACLLDLDRFFLIYRRDADELRRYWVTMHEEQTMGPAYMQSFNAWAEAHRATGEVSDSAYFGSVHNAMGYFLHESGLFAEAEVFLRSTLQTVIGVVGPEGMEPAAAKAYTNLALLLKQTNRLAEAEPLLRQALAIMVRSLGPNHPEFALELNNLGKLMQDMGRLPEAETLVRRALAIYEISLGPSHPTVAIALSNLAQILVFMERFGEAESLIRRALALRESNLGLDHPLVAADLNCLAQVLKSLQRIEEAESAARRAIEIAEAGLGPDHPEVASALNTLGLLLDQSGRSAEAEPLLRRALAINEHSFGPDHPRTVRALLNLTVLLYAPPRRLLEAEALARRALAIQERNSGTDQSDLGQTLYLLGVAVAESGRLAEAEPLLRRYVEILVNSSLAQGQEAPSLRRVIDYYGQMLLALGDTMDEVRTKLRKLGWELGPGL